jgi:hypothetical protein
MKGVLFTFVLYHEGGDLLAEDVGQHMAVLPEVATVTVDDIQVKIQTLQ